MNKHSPQNNNHQNQCSIFVFKHSLYKIIKEFTQSFTFGLAPFPAMVLPIANTLIKTLFTQSLSRIYRGSFCCTEHAFNKPNYISSSGPEEIKNPKTKPQACRITKHRAHLSYSQTPTQNASIRNQTQANPTYNEWQLIHNHEAKRGQVNTCIAGLPEWV